MKKIFALIVSLLLCFSFLGCAGGKNDGDDEEDDMTELVFEQRNPKTDGQLYTDGNLIYPQSLWQTPQFSYDSSLDPDGEAYQGVKAFFMESPIEYNGKPTKIMGYIGFPRGASDVNKVPAIVLIHGGLGTAFPDWVKLWTDRGYAAVSIDTEGGQAKTNTTMYNGLHDERNIYNSDTEFTAGPANNGFAIGGGIENIQNSWMYHATSAAILANSLIRSDSRVDSGKVGITGISWGGVVTSIVIGYDDRFAFAMPVYGCVALNNSSGSFNTFPDSLSKDIWDTTDAMELSTTPTLFVNSNKDSFFGLDAVTKCCKAVRNGFMAIKNSFPHGQEYGASAGELAVFADAVIGRENQVIKVTQNPSKSVPVMKFICGKDVTVNNIKLWYISDIQLSPSCVWQSRTLESSGNEININYPESATYCYVTITYNNNLVMSSQLIRLI